MAMVELDDVTKRFGASAVVDRASLTIADGEFVVLVGPSGCGKSTTLRMIAGLEGVSEGEIRIDGRRINETPPGKRNLAMVFQSYALYPHMSVAENMGFSLRCRGEKPEAIRAQVEVAAGILGLTELLDRRPSQLSGGQRQRVALGRAMVRQPECFLFDEPLSNLDAALRAHMRVELRQLRRRMGTTSIYVTHDQIEAMTLGDRIVVMDDGRIVQIGDPLEVYEWPNSRFVGAFLGAPPMNFVTARRAAAGGSAVSVGGADIVLPEEWTRALDDIGSEEVVVGVRPEHLTLAESGDPGGRTQPISGRVVLTEQHGGELLADIDIDGEIVKVARIPPGARLPPGQEVTVSVPPPAVRLFRRSGEALRP